MLCWFLPYINMNHAIITGTTFKILFSNYFLVARNIIDFYIIFFLGSITELSYEL